MEEFFSNKETLYLASYHDPLCPLVHAYHSRPPAASNTTTHCNTLQHTATHCNTLQHSTRHVVSGTSNGGVAPATSDGGVVSDQVAQLPQLAQLSYSKESAELSHTNDVSHLSPSNESSLLSHTNGLSQLSRSNELSHTNKLSDSNEWSIKSSHMHESHMDVSQMCGTKLSHVDESHMDVSHMEVSHMDVSHMCGAADTADGKETNRKREREREREKTADRRPNFGGSVERGGGDVAVMDGHEGAETSSHERSESCGGLPAVIEALQV